MDPELLEALRPVNGPAIDVSSTRDVFGSAFRVTEAAVACAHAFVASVAHLRSVQTGRAVRGTVDGLHAAVSFHSERLLSASRLPGGLWAPLTGNYRTRDGWLRIHANLRPHAEAARRVLRLERYNDATDAVRRWSSDHLVEQLRQAGGVAAAMRTVEQWRAHPHHEHLLAQPLIDRRTVSADIRPARGGSFLDGVRVLDCTRVIAGPVAGRLLSSFGADVVKVAGPLDDSPRLELDTGWGKTRRRLDLRAAADRAAFDELVLNADVLMEAFRPGAFAALGYDDAALRADNPGLVIGHLSAFGPDGPMGGLRGFDSVVQVATGIAHACGFDEEAGPSSLPAQALDHGAGHLLAAGIALALAARLEDGVTETLSVSLARSAEWLSSLGDGTGTSPEDTATLAQPYMRTIETSPYGTIRHVLPVGVVGQRNATWPPRPGARRQP